MKTSGAFLRAHGPRLVNNDINWINQKGGSIQLHIPKIESFLDYSSVPRCWLWGLQNARSATALLKVRLCFQILGGCFQSQYFCYQDCSLDPRKTAVVHCFLKQEDRLNWKYDAYTTVISAALRYDQHYKGQTK